MDLPALHPIIATLPIGRRHLPLAPARLPVVNSHGIVSQLILQHVLHHQFAVCRLVPKLSSRFVPCYAAGYFVGFQLLQEHEEYHADGSQVQTAQFRHILAGTDFVVYRCVWGCADCGGRYFYEGVV